jgi:hypothetical protein
MGRVRVGSASTRHALCSTDKRTARGGGFLIKRRTRAFAAVALCAALGLGSVACEDDDGFEEAGEAVDEAIDEVEDAVD